MKKIITVLIAGLLLFSSIGVLSAQERQQNQQKITTPLAFSDPTINLQENGMSISFEEMTGSIIIPGHPSIPKFTKVYTLPLGSTLDSIVVRQTDEHTITLTEEILPAPSHQLINRIAQPFYEKSSIYETNQWYPQNDFEYDIGAGIVDGKRCLIVSVTCYPLTYQPVTNEVKMYSNQQIEITFTPPDEQIVFADEYDMVIITDEKFSSSVQKLADHKNQMGIRTVIKTVQEIQSGYSGSDDPEKIKHFIRDAVESWGIDYVLMIGDSFEMPMRMAHVRAWDYDEIPTDLYYSDVYDEELDFCDWDRDNDGRYGEYDWETGPTDGQDMYPDVYIGRLPCKTAFDLGIMINKIISYETSASGSSWVNRALLMGGDTFPGHGVYEGEVVTGAIAEELSSFEITKLWTSQGNYNPLSINSQWSKGAGFVSYSGHGYMHGWGTSPPNTEQRIEYYSPYILGMLNMKKLPIVFFDACSTGHFDYVFNGISVSSIACLLLMLPFGGAVATIGSTRVAYTSVGHDGINGGAGYLNLHFFKAYEHGTSLGDMFSSTISDYLSYVYPDCLTLDEFTLFGDPSLKIGGY